LHSDELILYHQLNGVLPACTFEGGLCELRVTGTAPARVYMWTSQRLAEMSQDAELYCRASGNPQPTVTWYDPDEREIVSDDKQYKV